MLNRSEKCAMAGWIRYCTAVLCMLAACSAPAATVNGLYDAAVRVTDNSAATREAAFATALGIVAARVTGERDAPDKLGALLNSAPKYVQRYGYNSGFLEVGFDSSGVNQLLDQASLPLWGRERPVTLVVLPVSLQSMREARAAIEQTARLRGVPLAWAREVSDRIDPANLTQIQAMADRYGAAATLLARMKDPTSAASLQWQFVFDGTTQSIDGAIDEGPHLAADVLGKYYAVADKETATTVMDVAGIDGVDAYGTALNYLGGLSTVRTVKVESVRRDVVRFRLELRGAVENFRRSLDVDQKLVVAQPVAPVDATATASAVLSYRYNNDRP
ncbi:MAG TPA: DUF2066 domain-containing protein [Steroidobacteraceae bacterium]|nr:DUF2066 domain-containing protein [Steroidobacteraceae bacterium]